MKLSGYINSADINASDMPHEVVTKLQRAIDQEIAMNDNRMCYPFPMRVGERTFTAQVVVPVDLTKQEAERLCAFIETLIRPELQPEKR